MRRLICAALCVVLCLTAGSASSTGAESPEKHDTAHSNGKTALMMAARDRDIGRVRYLVRQGADVNKANNNGGTAIMYAALSGDLEIVRFIMNHGAKLNAVAKNGWSALMIAAAKGYADIARELLDHAADPNIQDVYLWSPLMRAVYEGREAVVGLLIDDPRTDINHRGENGITALHIAAAQGNDRLAEMLLEKGADKTIRDHAGRTPYQSARQTEEANLMRLLQ